MRSPPPVASSPSTRRRSMFVAARCGTGSPRRRWSSPSRRPRCWRSRRRATPSADGSASATSTCGSFPAPRPCRPTRSPGCSMERTVRPAGAAAVGAVLGADLDAVSSSALGPPARWWVLPEGGVVAEWPATGHHVVGGRARRVQLDDARQAGRAGPRRSSPCPTSAIDRAEWRCRAGTCWSPPTASIAATDVVAWTEHGRVYRLESSGVERGRAGGDRRRPGVTVDGRARRES